jgi:hypothetical protein
MKKSIIALLGLSLSCAAIADSQGKIVDISPATIIEDCTSCSSIDDVRLNIRETTDLYNNIVTVETTDKKYISIKIDSKYQLKVGQAVHVITDAKQNAATIALK